MKNKKLLVILPFVLLSLGGCNKKENKSSVKVKTFTVTWINYDGTVLEVDKDVAQGTVPSFDSETPTREPDAQYTYTFRRWGPEIGPVDRDITYTATYSSVVNEYSVTWLNYDGSVLKVDENIPYGETPNYLGDEPQKPGEGSQDYAFDHWEPEIVPVTGNVSYTAAFRAYTKIFVITWKNWNGKTLKMDVSVPYGTTPEYTGMTPTRPDDDEYTYTFTGWTPEVVPATSNATYTAVFSQNPIE